MTRQPRSCRNIEIQRSFGGTIKSAVWQKETNLRISAIGARNGLLFWCQTPIGTRIEPGITSFFWRVKLIATEDQKPDHEVICSYVTSELQDADDTTPEDFTADSLRFLE